MKYVERDPITENVVGVYALPQPGYAEEELSDDHPDIIAFLEERASREQNRISEMEYIRMRLDRIEKFLNFPIEGKLEGKGGGKLQNCRVRGRGTVL